MMTKIEMLWSGIAHELLESPLQVGGLKLKLQDPDFRFEIFAGVDNEGNVLLAVGTDSCPPAIAVSTKALDYFRKERAGGTWLMVLRLTRSGLEPVFGRLTVRLQW